MGRRLPPFDLPGPSVDVGDVAGLNQVGVSLPALPPLTLVVISEPLGPAESTGLVSKVISPYIIGSDHEGLAMTTLTITAKGQVTLRRDLLNHLGVHPGDKITVDKRPDGRIEVRAARSSGQISDVFNALKREGRPALSIEEIGDIAARGWAGRR